MPSVLVKSYRIYGSGWAARESIPSPGRLADKTYLNVYQLVKSIEKIPFGLWEMAGVLFKNHPASSLDGIAGNPIRYPIAVFRGSWLVRGRLGLD